jgi:hypothetical protein
MFASFKFIDINGMSYYESINVSHISIIKFKNYRNIDAGTILVMKSGEEIYTPETKDIIFTIVDSTMKEYAGIIMLQYLSEQAKILKERKTPITKSTVKATTNSKNTKKK